MRSFGTLVLGIRRHVKTLAKAVFEAGGARVAVVPVFQRALCCDSGGVAVGQEAETIAGSCD